MFQINNFVYFVEIITKLCINLKKIHLTTTSSKESVALQTEAFKDLKASLAENNVGLSVEYSEVLHDRQIRCVVREFFISKITNRLYEVKIFYLTICFAEFYIKYFALHTYQY